MRDIDRGYERIDERLRALGAQIERVPGDVIHPIPSGTRDVPPDELRELRVDHRRHAAVFDRFEYGEVSTPALEYETVLDARRLRGRGPRLPRCSTSTATCSSCART